MKKLLNIKAIAIVIAILVVIIGVAINFTTNKEETLEDPKKYCVIKAKDIITELKENSKHNVDYSKYTKEELDKKIDENNKFFISENIKYDYAMENLEEGVILTKQDKSDRNYKKLLTAYATYKQTALALQKEIKKRQSISDVEKAKYSLLLFTLENYSNSIECDE